MELYLASQPVYILSVLKSQMNGRTTAIQNGNSFLWHSIHLYIGDFFQADMTSGNSSSWVQGHPLKVKVEVLVKSILSDGHKP